MVFMVPYIKGGRCFIEAARQFQFAVCLSIKDIFSWYCVIASLLTFRHNYVDDSFHLLLVQVIEFRDAFFVQVVFKNSSSYGSALQS